MKVDWCNGLFILLQQIFLDELENKLIKIIHHEVKNNIPEIRQKTKIQIYEKVLDKKSNTNVIHDEYIFKQKTKVSNHG